MSTNAPRTVEEHARRLTKLALLSDAYHASREQTTAHVRRYLEEYFHLISARSDSEIWEVDVRGAERLEASFYQNPRRFWNGHECKPVSLPKGTLVCNTVTLRQKVS